MAKTKRMGFFLIAMILFLSPILSACGGGLSSQDRRAIKNVYDLISVIPSDVTDDNRNDFEIKLDSAQDSFDALSEILKENVSNRERLSTAREQLDQYDTDMSAINNVKDLINAIPSTVEDRAAFVEAIGTAKDSYNLLSSTLQAKVSNFEKIALAEGLLEEYDDEIAVLYVVNLINEIPATVSDRGAFVLAIYTAESAYGELRENLKDRVINFEDIATARTTLQEFDDEAAISYVENLISSIPNEVDVENRLSFEVAVYDAERAYDSLDSTLKGRVSNYSEIATAMAKIVAYDDNLAVMSVIEKITAINTPDPITEESRDAFAADILEARNAFDALRNQNLKDEVSNYANLEAAEAALLEYDQIAGVENLISEVPNEEITLENRTAFGVAVSTARAAYDALESQDIKDKISNYSDLEIAEAKIIVYDDNLAVENVTSLISAIAIPSKINSENREAFAGRILEAKNAYNALRNQQLKDRVSNYEYISTAERALTQYDEDQRAISAVASLISQIPETITRTTRNAVEKMIDDARTAYEALRNQDIKDEVSNYKNLTDAEEMLATFDANIVKADVVVGMVGQMQQTTSPQNRMLFAIEAREGYDSLTLVQQDLVTNRDILFAEESVIESYEDTDIYVCVSEVGIDTVVEWAVMNKFGEISDDVVEFEISFNFDGFEVVGGELTDAVVSEFVEETLTAETISYVIDLGLGQVTNLTLVAVMNESDNFVFGPVNTSSVEVRMLNVALENLARNEKVQIDSFGRSCTGPGSTGFNANVNINLAVGASLIVNYDENGNVSESYKYSFAYDTAGSQGSLASAGNGMQVARSEASRADRVYYNAKSGKVYNQMVYGWNNGSTINRPYTGTHTTTPTQEQIVPDWNYRDANNYKKEFASLDEWLDGAPAPARVGESGNAGKNRPYTLPYGLSKYIFNDQTIDRNAASSGSIPIWNAGTINTGSVTANRQFLTVNEDGSATFTLGMKVAEAQEENLKEIRRIGGLANVKFNANSRLWISMNFDKNMNLVGMTEYSRYIANSPVSESTDADTKGIVEFTFKTNDDVSDIPWKAENFVDKNSTHKNSSCVAEGTLITLSDGSQVAVEQLSVGDMVRVWNHVTGTFDVSPIIAMEVGEEKEYEILQLNFSGGTEVKIIYEHGFWDFDLNRYVMLSADNVQNYVGHWFNKQTSDGWEKVQLVNFEIYNEVTRSYSPISFGHLNIYVEGMLSMPADTGSFINIFEVNADTLAYNLEQMMLDIETYGLFDYYEDGFAEMVPEIIFEAFNAAYMKVAIGKGMMTWQDILDIIDQYSFLWVNIENVV